MTQQLPCAIRPRKQFRNAATERSLVEHAVALGINETDVSSFTKTVAGRNLALKMQFTQEDR
jgi:hypothetical protein